MAYLARFADIAFLKEDEYSFKCDKLKKKKCKKSKR